MNVGQLVIGYVSTFDPSKKFGLWLHLGSCLQIPIKWSNMSDLDISTVKQCVIASNATNKLTAENEEIMEQKNSSLAIYQAGSLIVAKITNVRFDGAGDNKQGNDIDMINKQNIDLNRNKVIELSMKPSDIYTDVKFSEKTFHSKALINEYFLDFRQSRDQFIVDKIENNSITSNDENLNAKQVKKMRYIQEYKSNIVRSLNIGTIMKCKVSKIIDNIIFVEWIFEMKVANNSWRNPHKLTSEDIKLTEILGVVSNIDISNSSNGNETQQIVNIYKQRQFRQIEFECNIVDIDWNLGFIKVYDPSIDATNETNTIALETKHMNNSINSNNISNSMDKNDLSNLVTLRSKPLKLVGDFSQSFVNAGSLAYGYVIYTCNYFVLIRIIDENADIADETRESYLGVIPIRTPFLQLPNVSKLFQIGELLRCNVLVTNLLGFIVCQLDYNTLKHLVSRYRAECRKSRHLKAFSATEMKESEDNSNNQKKRKFGSNAEDMDSTEPPKKRARLSVVTVKEQKEICIKSAENNILGSVYTANIVDSIENEGYFIIDAIHCRQLPTITNARIKYTQLCDDFENSMKLSKLLNLVLQMQKLLVEQLANQRAKIAVQKQKEAKLLAKSNKAQAKATNSKKRSDKKNTNSKDSSSDCMHKFDALVAAEGSDSSDEDETGDNSSMLTRVKSIQKRKIKETIRSRNQNIEDINKMLHNINLCLKSCFEVVVLRASSNEAVEFTAKPLFVEYCKNHAFPRYNAYQIPSSYRKIKHSSNIPVVGFIHDIDFFKQMIQVCFGGAELVANLSFDKVIQVLPFAFSEIKTQYQIGSTIIGKIENLQNKNKQSVEISGVNGLLNMNSFENDDIIACSKLFVQEYNQICKFKKLSQYCRTIEKQVKKFKISGKVKKEVKKIQIGNCIDSGLHLGQVINVEIKKLNPLYFEFEYVHDGFKYFGRILRPEHSGGELEGINIGKKLNVLVIDVDYQKVSRLFLLFMFLLVFVCFYVC